MLKDVAPCVPLPSPPRAIVESPARYTCGVPLLLGAGAAKANANTAERMQNEYFIILGEDRLIERV